MSAPEWLVSLPAPYGVLESVQRRGRQYLASLGLPDFAEESWRLCDLARLEALLKLPVSSQQTDVHDYGQDKWPRPQSESLRVVLDPFRDPLESISLPNGITPLTSEELEQTLGHTLDVCECNATWPIAINHACAMNVLALKVDGSDLPPLELVINARPSELSATRVVLVLEENARLDLLQVVLGSRHSAHSHLLEIHLGQEASLNHGWVALGGGDASLMAHLAVEQETRSNYELTSVQQGWLFGRLEPRLVQVNGQAKTVLRGLQIASKSEQLATHSFVRFDGPEGDLDQLQKAVASDSSHSIFNGAIDVPRAAQRTNAAQLSRNLLLSGRARIDTKPELQIVADDVRCAHGATVSQLQQDELFYMRSRGISSDRSMKLLLQGYCQEIIKCLPINGERWTLLDQLVSV